MHRATYLYRLHLALASAGVLAVVLSLLVALDATSHERSPSTLLAMVVVPQQTIIALEAMLLLVLGAIGVSSLISGARAAAAEIRLHVRTRRALASSREVRVGEHVVRVIAEERPLAFCSGMLRPKVYVSSGALGALQPAELAALTAHELHHAQCRDPLRLAVARVLGRALFFLPGLPHLLDRYRAQAELAADEAVLREGQEVSALASALLVFDERGAGVHPDRVEHLLGGDVQTRVPKAWLLTCLMTIAALVGLGLAGASELGHGPAYLVIPFLVASASLAAAGLLTTLLLLGGLVGSRRDRLVA